VNSMLTNFDWPYLVQVKYVNISVTHASDKKPAGREASM